MHSVCNAPPGCCFLKLVGRPRKERLGSLLTEAQAHQDALVSQHAGFPKGAHLNKLFLNEGRQQMSRVSARH